jgi:serine/threonine-protein kinase
MGRVYRAEHTGLVRTCAIKVMNPGLVSRQPQILERFWAEARALAGLVHPHIVTVHNLGSDRGYHYIEMEYVPGGVSLKETLVRQGALEPVRATSLVVQVVQALGEAHRSGLVHRDVKPANVLLTAEGRAKLADFGLVRGMSPEELAGAPVAGTPTFMAPELFRGEPADPRTDLYAVGVMYFYLLSARLPFASDNLSTLIRMHRRDPVPDIRRLVPEAPDAIAAILARCLAKVPEERYRSADELAEDLQAVVFQLRDTESLIRESLEGLDCVISGERDLYRILVQVPEGRLQEVRVEVAEGRRHRRFLSVYSVCCPADPSHYEFALKLNAELSYGGLSVRDVDGQPMFVMSRAYPGANASPAEVRAAVQEIARRSDWVEQQLTRADVF